MIADCGRGTDVGGLVRYLFGPGEANEHTNASLVVSWLGDDPAALAGLEPGGAGNYGRTCAGLAAQLRFPVDTFGGPRRYVWHVPISIAADEGRLTDQQWAVAARRVLERTGVARADDPGACRWVVVHHGPPKHGNDHVHLVATLVRQDGRTEKAWQDWARSRAAMAEIETEFGLRPTGGRDRTAERAPSRAEAEKARRAGVEQPARSWLTREVRTAAAGSTSRAEFADRLAEAGVAVRWRESVATPGEVTGYAVGRPGDANASGGQVWFGGSKLAPDLALPKLNARWREVAPPRALAPGVVAAETMPGVPRPRGLLSLEERAAILGRAARALERAAVDVAYAAAPEDPQAVGGDRAVGGNGAAAQGSPSATPAWAGEAVSAAEVATAFARAVEGDGGGPLTRAGDAMARAARLPGGARPDMSRRVHALRDVAAGLGLLGAALPDEAGAILTITAHLARIVDGIASARAAATPAGGRDPQARAGRRAVAAYAEHAGPVPAAQADRVRAALGGQLGRLVTADAGWPALAAALRRVDACGGDSIAVLVQASTSRKLDSARSAAAVLHYRVNLGAARAHQGTSQGPGPATASSPMLPGHSTEFHRPRGR